jgi:hypothetical protein
METVWLGAGRSWGQIPSPRELAARERGAEIGIASEDLCHQVPVRVSVPVQCS